MLAPWCWAILAVCVVVASELYLHLSADRALENSVRYLASVTLFCPMVAVLGAKRPQHNAWQLIVVALWGMLALPAAEILAFRPGISLELRDARGVFPWILILMPVMNWLPTRHWLSSGLFALAQAWLLAPYLPLMDVESSSSRVATALGIICASLVVLRLNSRQPSDAPSAADRVWLDFRDEYGVAWGLRIQQRVNEVSRLRNWGYSLSWFGFVSDAGVRLMPDAISPEVSQSIEQAYKTSLRRFVSTEWLESRL